MPSFSFGESKFIPAHRLTFDSRRCPGSVVVYDYETDSRRDSMRAGIFKITSGPNAGKRQAFSFNNSNKDEFMRVSNIEPGTYEEVKVAMIKILGVKKEKI